MTDASGGGAIFVGAVRKNAVAGSFPLPPLTPDALSLARRRAPLTSPPGLLWTGSTPWLRRKLLLCRKAEPPAAAAAVDGRAGAEIQGCSSLAPADARRFGSSRDGTPSFSGTAGSFRLPPAPAADADLIYTLPKAWVSRSP